MPPDGFSWIDKPRLAALARPDSLEEFQWLRQQGIQLLIALTEHPPRRHLINEAGLFSQHIPVEDFHAPSQRQIDLFISSVTKAHAQGLGVGVHCGAGLGRTGTMVACYLVTQGLSAQQAIARVRQLRPGSVETNEQATAVEDFAARWSRPNPEG
jgi:atypical dual specificity phosphatase